MKSLSPFQRGLLVGLVGLLIVGGVFLAGIVTAQQLGNPVKDDSLTGLANQEEFAYLEGSCQPICNQRGTLTVFLTSARTTGQPDHGGLNGRSAMHAICRAEDSASHFCSIQEIEHAWMTSGVNFANVIGYSWVDTAKLGSELNSYHEDINKVLTSKWDGGDPNAAQVPKNCYGWLSIDGNVRGLMLGPYAATVEDSRCNDELPVTCCK